MRACLSFAASLVAGIAVSAELAVAPIELKDVKRLPLEASAVADMPEALALKTPQNAVKTMTLAVANGSCSCATYRVTIDGGLPGFPAKGMSARKVLVTTEGMNDVGDAPLVEMDESCTVMVPAGTSGIVRFEFDAADVLPRTYRGILTVNRVDAEEPQVRIPISLEVLPRRLPELPDDALVLSSPAADERTFVLMWSLGFHVMTEANCRGTRQARRSVALAAYQMDSHHVRRYVDDGGSVLNEGDVQIHKDENGERFPPYPIDYGAIVPKLGECANLLVPVCLSASHIAFGSIRMEPVFFALGQAAGTAAALCAEKDCAVQDLKYAELRRRLLSDGQRL